MEDENNEGNLAGPEIAQIICALAGIACGVTGTLLVGGVGWMLIFLCFVLFLTVYILGK